MDIARRIATLAFVLAITACTQVPGASPGGSAPGVPATLPGSSASVGLPVGAPDGRRGCHAEGGSALPGACFPCGLKVAPGVAVCTMAINVNIPPLDDPTAPLSLISGLHPSDLIARYNLPVSDAGGTVAIVDAYDDLTAEADLAVYRLTFGMPPCTSLNGCFRKVNQQGQALPLPAVNVGWSQEIALDLDMVSAACPKCKILLIETNSNTMGDLAAGVDRAAAMGASAIGNSYYTKEWRKETAQDVHYDHPGVAVTVSSGDRADPFYPAASPYVTSVGGTSLHGSAPNWTETGWTYSGQGCSRYEPRPSYQKRIGDSCKTRSTVDVAAVADPQTGVAVFATLSGGWVVAGGTSVGAPLIAAAYALGGGGHGPAFSYAHRHFFYDISPVGYDLATGIGSPNGIGGL